METAIASHSEDAESAATATVLNAMHHAITGDARGPVRPTGISRGSERPHQRKDIKGVSLSVSMRCLFRTVTRYGPCLRPRALSWT